MTEQLTEREKEAKFQALQKRLLEVQREIHNASETLEYLVEEFIYFGSMLRTKEDKAKRDAEFKKACREAWDECVRKDPNFMKGTFDRLSKKEPS